MEPTPNPLAERIRAGLLTTEQVCALEPPPALVEGFLSLDSLAMLYGPSGTAKTFTALDIVQHVIHGSYWHDHLVHAGPVLYVIAEGSTGFGPRVEAWKAHHRPYTTPQRIDWYPEEINISDPGWTGALAEVVAELRPVLVVLDTLARCTVGAEENSARDMGRVVHHLDVIRRAAGSCVLLVHHSGKDSTAGARGSSALRAAMDTELELSGDAQFLQLRTTKQKDRAPAGPLNLRLLEVGESVVVTAAGHDDDARLDERTASTLAALMDADVDEGLSSSAWLKVTDVAERTFYRHRSALLRRGLVVNVGTPSRPRYRPATGEEVAA